MSRTPTLIATAAGVCFGLGTTPPTVDDYKLENQITAGVTITRTSETGGRDQNGNPLYDTVYSIKNNTAAAITVSEIGWRVDALCNSRMFAGGGGYYNTYSLLIDRTVLDNPITIAAGETGLVKYTVSASFYHPKTVAGVQIVPFAFGTDEQIVAMIEAARAGTIDLQRDAGWQIGDSRAVSVGAVDTYNPYTEYVIISSFDEYEGCGNVLQLEFTYRYLKSKMNSSNTNSGGYGASYMYTTFLPLVEAALPSWLRSLLLPFDVKVSAGSRSSEIVTVQNNKLALRSEVEIFGTMTYSPEGEGQLQELFKRETYRSRSSSSTTGPGWCRSPDVTRNAAFVYGTASSSYANASNSNFVLPFMCI